MMKARSLVLLAGLCLLAVDARAGDAVKRFKAAWRQAGEDPEKRIAALQILSEDEGENLAALLKYGFAPGLNYRIQDAAFEVMAGMKGEAARAWLSKNFRRRRRASERVILARVAAGYPSPEALEVLGAGLEDKEETVRKASARLLGRVKSPGAVEALIAALEDAEEGRMAAACRDSLRLLTGQKSLDAAQDWATWWAQNKEGFDPSTVSATEEPRVTVRRGVTTTTRDGSGLYSTIDSTSVVFVVDVSNSMRIPVDDKDPKSLSRLDFVRQELSNAIEAQLGAKALFNIVVFSTQVQVWKRTMVRASKGNKKAALRFLKKLQPTDRTDIYGALRAAFQVKGADTIYFLTDGTPTEGDLLVPVQIRGAVRSWNRGRDVTVHTIAFLTGSGSKLKIVENKSGAREFMKALAEDNNGRFRAME